MNEVTVLGAAFAGLLSFLSPCILPIVPFYLSYLAGMGAGSLRSGDELPADLRTRALVSTVAFSAGIISIFVALGASASLIGAFVREYFDVLRWLAAAIVIVMGFQFLGVLRIPLLYRQMRSDTGGRVTSGVVGGYIAGLAFAFGWTPCVGPVLASILFIAAGQDTLASGACLLFAYGVGMTFPFVLASFFMGSFLRWASRFRPFLSQVERTMGALLVCFGLLIASDSISNLAFWLVEIVPWFSEIG